MLHCGIFPPIPPGTPFPSLKYRPIWPVAYLIRNGADMAQTTDTPEDTLQAATQEGILPRRGMTLLGTFVRDVSPMALVRVRPGDVRTVSLGDQLGTSIVMAIESGALYLAQNGVSRRLTLPEA